MKEYRTEGPRIELHGNRVAVIDGCDGIVDYDDNKVVVNMNRLIAELTGKKLKLKLLTENSAVVEGFIFGVHYELKRG